MLAVTQTRYAVTSDDNHIAYQVVGEGPPDIVYANSFMGHVEVSWEYARAANFYERMASFSRLVLFDRRGTGLSDPIVGHFDIIVYLPRALPGVTAADIGTEVSSLLGARVPAP
jgi:pimeloyl-ACP methyl ester carboxylesterase